MENTMQKYSEKCWGVNNIGVVIQNTGGATGGTLHHGRFASCGPHREDVGNVG